MQDKYIRFPYTRYDGSCEEVVVNYYSVSNVASKLIEKKF
jgi:hypothetical protein